MAGWLTAKGSASSVTEASPFIRRARIARRVGSARALKVASSCWGESTSITILFYNMCVMDRPRRAVKGEGVRKKAPPPGGNRRRLA